MESSPELVIRHLGLVDYQPTLEAMRRLTEERGPDTPDEIWLLQHPRGFTQGQVTYHGPGQLVGYLMLDLRRKNLGVRELVTAMEQSLVDLLALYGVDAAPKADAPGVYVGADKIASLGLRVRRGCSFHGLALNLDMDLEPFRRINPCGYAGLRMTQLSEHVSEPVDVAQVEQQLAAVLRKRLGYDSE